MRPENLLQRPLASQKCTLGCQVLDRCLGGGGLPCNSVTELVSESGCGKTQLCLQLLLHAQLPLSAGGLASSSLYLHSEFPFPLRRLRHLSISFRRRHSTAANDDDDPCDRIFVRGVHSADHLLDVLSQADSLLSNSLARFPIKLIVIDSIAALFRSEFDNNSCDLRRRSSMFFNISARLKALAHRFGLAVLVTNQVTDVMESNEGLNGLRVGNVGRLYSSGRRVCPALGLAWANCLNSRLFLSRDEEIVGKESGAGDADDVNNNLCRRTRRRLHVLFAPHLPESSCEFVILREGVFGVQI